MFHLVVVAAAGLLLWLAVNRVEWFRQSRLQYSQTQQALFTELCQTHDLSRSDRTLLSLISQSTAVNQSCRVFVDPQVIQQFAQNRPENAEQCLNLVGRLFGV